MGKVLFIINQGVYPYRVGGMEVFNYHLIKSLCKKYREIAYISSAPYDFNGARYISSCSLRPTKLFTPLWVFIYLLFHPEYRTVVISFSDAHWLVWQIYALAIRLLKLKAIVVIHYGKNVPSDHYDVYRTFLQSAHKVVAVSDDIKNNYDSAFDLECNVIYPLVPFRNAVETSAQYREFYDIPQDARVVSMVGSLKQMKNPQRVLEALSLFTKQELTLFKPFILYAGGGSMMPELMHFVQENGLSEYVKFLGIVPNDKIVEIMTMSDVYLIASDFEGTSVSLLEAMYNSKPIIASDVPGLRDMITDGTNGLLYEVDSSKALKMCLIKMFSDVDLACQLGNAAKVSYEEKYSYEKMLRSYESLLL